jgi:hypothetical protein
VRVRGDLRCGDHGAVTQYRGKPEPTVCKYGHPLANPYIRPATARAPRAKECRTCHNRWQVRRLIRQQRAERDGSMLFKPVLINRIFADEKTHTRRPTRHLDGREVRYVVGGTYAVQPGRGKHHVGHIKITSLDVGPLGDLTPEQAKQEGFPSPAEFARYWRDLHGRYDRNALVVDLGFERAAMCDDCHFW